MAQTIVIADSVGRKITVDDDNPFPIELQGTGSGVLSIHSELNVSGTASTAGDNTIVSSPGPGQRIVVTSFTMQNESAAATVMILRSIRSVGRGWRFLGQNQGDEISISFHAGREWRLAPNEDLVLNLDGANQCGYSVQYYVEGVAQTYFQKVLSYGPILYYPMNEAAGVTAVDYSGGSRDGTYSGVTLGQPGIGDGNTCPYFDGTSGYLNAFSASLAAAFNGVEGSFGIWVKPDPASHNDSTLRRILYSFIDANNYIIIAHTGTNSNIQYDYKAGGTAETQTNVAAVLPTDFAFVGMTWSKANDRVRYYYDTLIGSDTGIGNWAGAIPVFVIGATTVAPTGPYYGWLASAVLFDRELSQTDMEHLGSLT